jgi:hypothetical protein
MMLKRNLINKLLLVVCGVTLAACSTSPLDPDNTNPNTNGKPKLEELIKATLQNIDIEPDSIIALKNYGTAHSMVVRISFRKSDEGKGVPVIYKYTGKPLENIFTKSAPYTNGSIQFTMINDQAFDMVVKKGEEKPLLHNDSVSYKSFGIAQIYTNVIRFQKAENVEIALMRAKQFMQVGKDLNGTIIEVSGTGIKDEVVINSKTYKIN